jgi:hypothetical protein
MDHRRHFSLRELPADHPPSFATLRPRRRFLCDLRGDVSIQPHMKLCASQSGESAGTLCA